MQRRWGWGESVFTRWHLRSSNYSPSHAFFGALFLPTGLTDNGFDSTHMHHPKHAHTYKLLTCAWHMYLYKVSWKKYTHAHMHTNTHTLAFTWKLNQDRQHEWWWWWWKWWRRYERVSRHTLFFTPIISLSPLHLNLYLYLTCFCHLMFFLRTLIFSKITYHIYIFPRTLIA